MAGGRDAGRGSVQGVPGRPREDPRLVGLGERPPLGSSRLLIGHPTILPRHGGLVGEGHRHCLDRPVSPCFTSKGLIGPMCHISLTERGVRSPTCSAMVHPLRLGRSPARADRYSPECWHVCVRAKHDRRLSIRADRSRSACAAPILAAAAASDSFVLTNT